MRTESSVVFSARPDLDRPILIEGLPGVGNVGKIAADFLADTLEAKHLATLTSCHLPPQVLVDGDGVAVPPTNELYYLKDVGTSHLDVILLLGEFQATTPDGQYMICDDLMKRVFLPYDVSTVFTLGGYGTGQVKEDGRVLGAASSLDMKERLEPYGVEFSPHEPPAGIVGASGILVGLSQQYGIDAACIIGETSGFFADYKAGMRLLTILERLLGLELDMSELEDKARQIDEINNKVMEYAASQHKPDNLGYIG